MQVDPLAARLFRIPFRRTRRVAADRPTPGSSEILRRVRPLASAGRAASRWNSGLAVFRGTWNTSRFSSRRSPPNPGKSSSAGYCRWRCPSPDAPCAIHAFAPHHVCAQAISHRQGNGCPFGAALGPVALAPHCRSTGSAAGRSSDAGFALRSGPSGGTRWNSRARASRVRPSRSGLRPDQLFAEAAAGTGLSTSGMSGWHSPGKRSPPDRFLALLIRIRSRGDPVCPGPAPDTPARGRTR